MKWVTILSFVVVLSLTESRILQKREHQEGHHEGQEHHEVHPEGHHDGQEHHEGHPEGHHDGQKHHEEHPESHHGGHHADTHLIGDDFKLVGKEYFEALVLVEVSQNLQLCPFEEHLQRAKDVEAIAEKCSKGIKTAECGKPVVTVLVDEMCKRPENAEKYPHHADCCAKAENERYACFVSHKLTAPDSLPPYQKKDPEQTCKAFHDNERVFLEHYIYELARRFPRMYSPAVLYFAHRFELITSECCKDIAHCATCFDEKKPPLKEEMIFVYAKQQHSCYVLEEFGERALKALKLVQISQKMPKASFQNVVDIVHELLHLTESCCSRNNVECMADRMALSKKACEKKDELSSKLKECCEKDIIERSSCIVKMEFDDKPADLSTEVREFIDDPKVCQHYKDEKDQHLAKFTYENARRHPELAPQQHLRVAVGYEGSLKKCCGAEDELECLGHAEEAMKEAIKIDKELLKTRCDGLEKLGTYLFENKILVDYTKKMPQVTTPSLIEMAEHMALTGEKCCKLPAEKQMPCSETGLSIIIAKMCQKMKGHFVNDQVSHCCKDSYSAQRTCFTNMGPDKSYVPPAPSTDHFHFTDELCAAADQHALETRKQTFLVNLIKMKPDISTEQLQKIIPDFLTMVEHCCKEESHEACFKVEGPKLIHKCEEILHLHVAEEVGVKVAV